MSKKIAFLSAEFSVTPKLPIFAGGLGVLAGDILYQADDLGLPLVGITLFHQEGCFNQRVDAQGVIREDFLKFSPVEAGLQDTGVTVEVPFPDRIVVLKVWKQVVGKIPLYLLDTDVPENNEVDRKMAYRLYDGRVWPPRIERDLLLGVGGVRALRKLEKDVSLWHINDDHTAFSLFERIRERVAKGESLSAAREAVRKETVYTTHTPSLAAESIFDLDETAAVLAMTHRWPG
jgi:starch phosphorylase